MIRRKILLVDDDPSLRRMFSGFLSAHEFLVEEAESFEVAHHSFNAVRPDLAIIDFRLPDGTALELLPRLKEIEPTVPIIVMTGYGSMELGIALIKAGAEQCLAKPVEPPALLLIVNKVLENSRNQQKQIASKTKNQRGVLDPFLGVSGVIERMRETAYRIADSHSPVLIQGETGTGKGVLANWLHENGPRADEALVDLNCAGLTREFLESELFGYEKGAYTGAVTSKPGLLEVAHRGTVFLDEIGDVDGNVQPKLLKVVEEKRFRRMGDVRDRFVDIRLIAATHQDLRRLIEEKQFRSDLYFRISTVPIVLPSLRERPEDIPLLTAEILHRVAGDIGRPAPEIHPEAMTRLGKYAWPGNIRELRNVLERALLMAGPGVPLETRHFFFEATGGNGQGSYGSDLTLAALEKMHIERVVREETGNIEAAAKRLGISRSALYQRLRALNIPFDKKKRSTAV